MITGSNPLPIPYTIQINVLTKTISIMDKLRSFTLLLFQVWYTWGIKVRLLSAEPI